MKLRMQNGDLGLWTGSKDRSTDRHHERRSTNKFLTTDFIALDGEGINPKRPRRIGEQWYAYLAASSGESIKRTGRDGLTTEQCCEFLLSLSSNHKQSTFVIFAGGYDMNMWLRDVPRETLQKIYDGGYGEYKNYSIKYVPRKTLTIGKFGARKFTKDKHGKRKPNYIESITVWDVWGFFSCSFVKAIKEYKIVTEEELAIIEHGKLSRTSFTKEALDTEIIPYCQLELDLLVRLMKKMRNYLEKAQLFVTRWDGAGAIAGALLKREKIREYLGRDTTPDIIERLAANAFSGGRIECIRYGHHAGKCYSYDLNSAYPSMAQHLPSLQGTWEKSHTSNPLDFTARDIVIVDVSWNLAEEAFYPFFVRDVTKSICYPREGRNRMYVCELLAYINTHPDWKKHIIIHNAYIFYPDKSDKPFSFIPELYTMRRAWKQQGEGAEKVVKLGINSVYGKLVQQKGYLKDDAKEGKDPRPPYFALPWAGMITAGTRSTLYEAAIQKAKAVIMFATDGIYTTEQLDVTMSNQLGDWEYTEYSSITVVQSGVYWLESLDGMKSYYRGFDADTLSQDMILDGWERRALKVTGKTSRFITLGTSLITEERFTNLWRTWQSDDRSLDLHPDGKRIAIDHTCNAAQSLQKTTAQRNPNTLLSTFHVKHGFPEECLSIPYALPWELERIDTPEELEIDAELTESQA